MINEFNKEALNLMKEQNDNLLIWGAPPDTRTDEEKFEDDLRFAILLINGNQEVVNFDPETKKAYKTGSYGSLEKPIEEISYESFVRWARPMDM